MADAAGASDRPDAPGDLPLILGLGGALAGFGSTFRGPRKRFWQRMTYTGLGLGGYALLAARPARRVKVGPAEIAMGLGSAAVLYGTFTLGDRFARRFVPGGDAQIREIYALRSLRPRGEIAARLMAVVGPAVISHAVRRRMAACRLAEPDAYWKQLQGSEDELQQLIRERACDDVAVAP